MTVDEELRTAWAIWEKEKGRKPNDYELLGEPRFFEILKAVRRKAA